MASARSFPLTRTTHNSTSWNKKRPRPPSLKLEESFRGWDNKGNLSNEPAVQAVRGSVSEPCDRESDMVPMKVEMEVAIPAPLRVASAEAPAKTPGSPKAPDTLLTGPGESMRTGIKDHNEEPIAETRSVSPQESLRKILQLGIPHDSDDDPDISLMPDDRHPTRSGTVLDRLFPELSSNFRITSPASADQMKSVGYHSLFESELEERVQNLYLDSRDAANEEDEVDRVLEQKTGSSSGSDEIFDCASSCYSRRSSVTSVDTELGGEGSPYKSADAYSIFNPVSAGVFDDAASVCLSRVPSVASKMSMEELKNKPLPLEPIREPSPLAIRRSVSPPSTISQQPPTQHLSATHRPDLHHSGTKHREQPGQSYKAFGGHREHRSRRDRRGEWHDHSHGGQRLRHVPTLSQAAEELEYALAELAKDPNMKQRTLLVLDGPLQISRHNGDLVATRPAPQPPSMKPHSQSHRNPSWDALRPVNKDKPRRAGALKAIRESPTKAKGHKKNKSKDSKSSDEKKDKPKAKMSFNLSMPSFSRKQIPGVQDRRLSVLSSRSETSLDPHETDELRLSRRSTNSDLTPASKREDLLLQLPRLQTQDLVFKNLFDRLWNQGVARSTSASPTPPAESDLNSASDARESLELRIVPPEDEKILVACDKMRQTHAFVSTAQASSVRLPPEQVYELAATPPSPSPVLPERERLVNDAPANLSFPVNMPDRIIVSMMERVGSLDDLFNFVLVNKRFYVIFKMRELSLIKNALFNMSSPAWELREMSPPWATEWQLLLDPDSQVPEYTPTLYLDRYAGDIYTLARLKSMILVRCAPFLRRETLRGLSGVDPVRAEEVDDAFWRIWTFCRIFGSGKGREADLEGQMDWLKGGSKARNSFGATSSMTEPFGMNNVLFEPPEGFALGNRRGLSQKQMYDMTEIWTCLAVLLQPMHGKCIEARKVGIFDGMNLTVGDTVREETALEEWTSYVLTLGLTAVLTLSSLSPAEATTETFEKAQSVGLTKWELTETETSRSSFLKEAISRVYEEQERALSTQSDSPCEFPSRETEQANAEAERARERQHAFKLELRARRLRGAVSNRELGTSFANERPMSEFSTIVRNLDGSIRHTATDAPSVPPVPALTFDRFSTSTSSTAPGTPNHSPPPSNQSDPSIPLPRSPPLHLTLAPPPLRPQVQDPVDRAFNRMVNELGFNEDDVKWALKITDTGEGINVQAAETLLRQQKRRFQHNPFAPRGKDSLLQSVMKRQGSQDSGWRWA